MTEIRKNIFALLPSLLVLAIGIGVGLGWGGMIKGREPLRDEPAVDLFPVLSDIAICDGNVDEKELRALFVLMDKGAVEEQKMEALKNFLLKSTETKSIARSLCQTFGKSESILKQQRIFELILLVAKVDGQVVPAERKRLAEYLDCLGL